MPSAWFGLKQLKSLVELTSANSCRRSINTGFQVKLLNRMILPKKRHFKHLERFRFSLFLRSQGQFRTGNGRKTIYFRRKVNNNMVALIKWGIQIFL